MVCYYYYTLIVATDITFPVSVSPVIFCMHYSSLGIIDVAHNNKKVNVDVPVK